MKKVVIHGSHGVGKTSLASYFVNGTPPPEKKSMNSYDVSSKQVTLRNGNEMGLEIWDVKDTPKMSSE